MGHTTGSAVRIYQINYIVGFSFGCILFFAVNRFFPPPGVGLSEEFNEAAVANVSVTEGVSAGTSSEDISLGVGKKEMNVRDRQVLADSV
jgi:hypothetical protein